MSCKFTTHQGSRDKIEFKFVFGSVEKEDAHNSQFDEGLSDLSGSASELALVAP